MSLLALGILFISACMHASWNYLAKQSKGGNVFVALYMVMSFLWMSPIALYFLYRNGVVIDFQAILFMLGSVVLHIIYSLSLQYGYKLGDLSLLYPIARGTGPLIVAIAAVFLYGEILTWQSVSGILLIVGSIFILSGGLQIIRQKNIKITVLYGIYVGIIIAGYTLVDKGAVTVAGLSPLIYFYFVLIGQLLVLMPYIWKQRKYVKTEWQKNWRSIIGVGVLSPLAYILVLAVMTFIPISHVAPVREMSILLGTIMGILLLKEKAGWTRLIGAGLMVVGVIIVALN